jgi:hypothetical protein
MSAFVTNQQTEETLALLKSRNFLLSFENKKLSERVNSLERYVIELKMKLSLNDQDRNEHSDGSGQDSVPSPSGETQLQWSF